MNVWLQKKKEEGEEEKGGRTPLLRGGPVGVHSPAHAPARPPFPARPGTAWHGSPILELLLQTPRPASPLAWGSGAAQAQQKGEIPLQTNHVPSPFHKEFDHENIWMLKHRLLASST